MASIHSTGATCHKHVWHLTNLHSNGLYTQYRGHVAQAGLASDQSTQQWPLYTVQRPRVTDRSGVWAIYTTMVSLHSTGTTCHRQVWHLTNLHYDGLYTQYRGHVTQTGLASDQSTLQWPLYTVQGPRDTDRSGVWQIFTTASIHSTGATTCHRQVWPLTNLHHNGLYTQYTVLIVPWLKGDFPWSFHRVYSSNKAVYVWPPTSPYSHTFTTIKPNTFFIQSSFEFYRSYIIILNETPLNQISDHKALGITIDQTLSWDIQIKIVCKNLTNKLSLLNKIKRDLPKDYRILYYNAYTQPIILLCLINLSAYFTTQHTEGPTGQYDAIRTSLRIPLPTTTNKHRLRFTDTKVRQGNVGFPFLWEASDSF